MTPLTLTVSRAGRAALGVGDQGGLHFGDVAVGVFDAAGAFDDVAVFQAHLVADGGFGGNRRK